MPLVGILRESKRITLAYCAITRLCSLISDLTSKKEVTKLKKHTRYKISAFLVALFTLLATFVPGTWAYVTGSTGPVINEFKPMGGGIPGATGELLINVTVEHPFGDDFTIPDSVSFEYKVELGAEHANKSVDVSINDSNSLRMTADENGIITLHASSSQTVAVRGIEAGTRVYVTQVKRPGFIVKDGKYTKEAEITSAAPTAVDFTNVYVPETISGVPLDIVGEKILEGREWQEGDLFSFRLEFWNDDGEWESLGEETVTFDPENEEFYKFDLSDEMSEYRFERAGTHYFRIVEVVGSLEDVDYDKTENRFEISLEDSDMDGMVDICDITATQNAKATYDEVNGRYKIEVTFNNTYDPGVTPPDPPIPPDPPGPTPRPDDIVYEIKVDNHILNFVDFTSISPADFEYKLVDVDTGEVLIEKTDENGNAIFELDYTADDIGKTFSFKLTQVNGEKEGVTYSDIEYQIQLTIALNVEENKLEVDGFCSGDIMDEDYWAEFRNFYKPAAVEEDGFPYWIIIVSVLGAAAIAAGVVFGRKQYLKKKGIA